MTRRRISKLTFTLWLGCIFFLVVVIILYAASQNEMEQLTLQNPMHRKQLALCSFESLEDVTMPTLEYEHLRHRIQANIAEIWNYFNGELQQLRQKIKESKPVTTQEIDAILQLGAEHKRSLLSDMERLRQVDGYEKWRVEKSKNLSDLVQRRLHYLQNSKQRNCTRKWICRPEHIKRGFGCQLHQVVNCLIAAYANKATMILESSDWHYHKAGWESIFLPVSENCAKIDPDFWVDKTAKQLSIDISQSNTNLPLELPKDLAPCLQRLHGAPFVWWVGQFLKYLLRTQKHTAEYLELSKLKLGWQKPIVGVHVRRTDKVGTEAAFHSIEEYMPHVEDYFLTLEINGKTTIPRRIFLATDDAKVVDEARKKYTQYQIIGSPQVTPHGILLDIHLLSLCDYLVCTFSSNVCRVAYEIMQTLQPDAAHRFKSLDDTYFYTGQHAHYDLVIIAHKARNAAEIDMQVGDLIHVAGNHWDGYSKGTNLRTNVSGLFPSFKVIAKVEIVPMPRYEQVPVQ